MRLKEIKRNKLPWLLVLLCVFSSSLGFVIFGFAEPQQSVRVDFIEKQVNPSIIFITALVKSCCLL